MNAVNQKLILELINFKNYDKESIQNLFHEVTDIPELLGHLIYNRIAGVAYHVMCQSGAINDVNPEIVVNLNSIYMANIIKNQEMEQELEELADSFQNSGIIYALLKGSFITPVLYEKGFRTSNDIDILVRQDQVEEITQLLRSMGYEQRKFTRKIGYEKASRKDILLPRLNYGELLPFYRDIDKNIIKTSVIDVNISLDFQSKKKSELVNRFLSNTVEYEVNGKTLKTLDYVDFFLQLCAHLYKEATIYNWVARNKDTLLYKYIDFYVFILRYGDLTFFDLLEQRINQYGMHKEVYYSLHNTMRLFPTLICNNELKAMMNKLKINDDSFLTSVYWPAQNRHFVIEDDFIEWIFTTNKKEKLVETDA